MGRALHNVQDEDGLFSDSVYLTEGRSLVVFNMSPGRTILPNTLHTTVSEFPEFTHLAQSYSSWCVAFRHADIKMAASIPIIPHSYRQEVVVKFRVNA
ncbi:hypothetical protein RRG08_017576 [Elysia crispata]|uniref:Uncharacterized protein n=1 Tax=Elysia crispata TaxID=231223 RepID=A0AAE1CWS4_9GAST|nr:hypothetical protein RRG08_017576 [Elysia crispata]